MKRLLCMIFVTVIAPYAYVNGAETDYTQEKDIHYCSDAINKSDAYVNERCVLDIYYPKEKKDFATIIWFHGGGLYTGNKSVPYSLKKKNVAVVAPNYRLHPKVKAPVYIEDAAAAVAWVFKNIEKYGGDPDKIFILESIFGNLLDLTNKAAKHFFS